jgi:predicted amidohydrolase
VIDVDGWRIGLAICKDTGVSEHARATATRGIEVYAAGVLETASEAPLLEKRARRIAMEHGVWVAVASFAGSTGGGYAPAAGRSAIWSPDGLAMVEAGPDVGAFVRAVLG